MNFVLGSGLIGYLAKEILGQGWSFVPFKRSRYFTFGVPYADNFIRYNEDVDLYMSKHCMSGSAKLLYKRPFSYCGQLIYNASPMVVSPYLSKIYGADVPMLAPKLLDKMTFMIYPITAKQLHDKLQNVLRPEIDIGVEEYGEMLSIDLSSRTIKTSKGSFEYDKIVSTIPLDVLYKFCGFKDDLKSRNVCYYYIIAEDVNLEGADQALVADPEILFFKVMKVDNKHGYLFWTLDVVEKPLEYFGSYLGYKIDIIEVIRMDKAIPVGEPPDLKPLEDYGIRCVGSNAQWDDFVDINQCIRRLFKV